eukprot:g7776.t1
MEMRENHAVAERAGLSPSRSCDVPEQTAKFLTVGMSRFLSYHALRREPRVHCSARYYRVRRFFFAAVALACWINAFTPVASYNSPQMQQMHTLCNGSSTCVSVGYANELVQSINEALYVVVFGLAMAALAPAHAFPDLGAIRPRQSTYDDGGDGDGDGDGDGGGDGDGDGDVEQQTLLALPAVLPAVLPAIERHLSRRRRFLYHCYCFFSLVMMFASVWSLADPSSLRTWERVLPQWRAVLWCIQPMFFFFIAGAPVGVCACAFGHGLCVFSARVECVGLRLRDALSEGQGGHKQARQAPAGAVAAARSHQQPQRAGGGRGGAAALAAAGGEATWRAAREHDRAAFTAALREYLAVRAAVGSWSRSEGRWWPAVVVLMTTLTLVGLLMAVMAISAAASGEFSMFGSAVWMNVIWVVVYSEWPGIGLWLVTRDLCRLNGAGKRL